MEKPATNVFKTSSKNTTHKTAEATSDLVGYRIAEMIPKSTSTH